jgi:hypothetical protein
LFSGQNKGEPEAEVEQELDACSELSKVYNWVPAPESSDSDDDNSSKFLIRRTAEDSMWDKYGTLAALALSDDDDEDDAEDNKYDEEYASTSKSETEEQDDSKPDPEQALPDPEVRPFAIAKDEIDKGRAMAFCASQLAPLSFLDSADWINMRPANFLVYVKLPEQFLETDAEFYIEERTIVSGFGLNAFIVSVVGPSGESLPIELGIYPRDRGTLRCTFRPLELGEYFISVSLGVRGSHFIDGSPLKITITEYLPLSQSTDFK